MANNNLINARKAKNDEFYTMLEDIELELSNYKDKFSNKIVYCNCDNPKYSKFWEYFHRNFAKLGLKKLIATFYSLDTKPYKMEYSGGNDEDIKLGDKTNLKFNGDFRSFECIKILDECDIVVTNPPFSLFRDFISLVVSKKNKELLVIGNMNAITYKEVFPLIKGNKLWLGATHFNDGMYFYVPEDFEYSKSYKFEKYKDNKKVSRVAGVCWFTNIDLPKRHKLLKLESEYTEDKYKKFDNYDAINVDNVSDIPKDYNGYIGVPITFINRYNPDQFEIICHEHDINGNGGEGLKEGQFEVDGKGKYKRVIVRKR